ncbi:MAG: PfkB family carbohydrate kinase, partial [Kiritimatiellia bacterium]|nr:PfkB family carbohydrate kinase [Kiritimatiellia bacterium]
MSNNFITVIGSANVDLIMKVPQLPAHGETVLGGEFTKVYGGKGANTAVAAARAGGLVSFVACLGADHDGLAMKKNYEEDGIDASLIQLVDGESCGTALIMFDATAENFIGVASGANGLLTPEMVRRCTEQIARSDYVLLQMEIPIESIEEVLNIATDCSTTVILNYAPVGQAELEVTEKIAGLIVNEVEASE